jgi:hypothetical protein
MIFQENWARTRPPSLVKSASISIAPALPSPARRGSREVSCRSVADFYSTRYVHIYICITWYIYMYIYVYIYMYMYIYICGEFVKIQYDSMQFDLFLLGFSWN